MLSVAAPAVSPSPPATHVPTAKALAAIFLPLVSPQEPGLSVVVRLNGRTVFKRGYGKRDLRSNAPIRPPTNFRLASCTKQFTAAAVLLLVHDGKLHLDNRLTDVFPEFPAYGKGITLRNLLNHTSGLVAYEDVMDRQYSGKTWENIPQISDDGVLKLMEQQTGTKFPPGTAWEYSNSGFCVLARVIEKASGMSFADFLRRRIFSPLKMSSTMAYENGKGRVRDRAYGYTRNAGGWLETDQSPTSATLGDGGVYSSVDDLSRWDDALRRHTLLSEAEMRPMLIPVGVPQASSTPPATGGPIQYGFGWYLDPYRGHARMWHNGESIGFRTVIDRFRDEGLTVVILANRSDLDPAALALKVADLYIK